MRRLWVIPVMWFVAIAIGVALYRALGWNMPLRDLECAAVIALIGAAAGVGPAIALRNSTQPTVAQAGLAGTVAQMMLSLFLAMGAASAHLITSLASFSIWLLIFYWSMLAAVVAILLPLIKNARPEQRNAGA